MAVNALTQGELQYVKYALEFNQLTVGAEPYVGITRYFEQIVQSFINGGPLAICSTSVPAAPLGGPPVAVALTLDSATGINMFDAVVVDVDAAREVATVQSVTSNVIVVQLYKAHGTAGAYPVETEGGISLVRQFIGYLRRIDVRIDQFGARAGVKKADEVEFFGGAHGRSSEANGFKTLEQMRDHFRRQLCMLLFGCGSVQEFGGGSSRIGVY